jgi:copper chaperone CopZ
MRVTHLEISGMNAKYAVQAVYTAIGGIPGVEWAEVNLGRAQVEHDGSVTRELLEEAVATAGFQVTGYREERRLPLR